MVDRHGDVSVANVKWRKPVVMLINGGTRSGKEILAYGFKKYGLGEVIGTQTAGAVLAARAFLLSDGSLLLLAVNDVFVDGQRLEGVGVTPTLEVPFPVEYAQGKIPQLERADLQRVQGIAARLSACPRLPTLCQGRLAPGRVSCASASRGPRRSLSG